MNNTIKNFFRPIRRLITKVAIEPSELNKHISKQVWHDTNAFRWASAYIVKNQISGDYLEFGVWKGNSFIESYNQITNYSKMFFNVGLKSKKYDNPFLNIKYHAFDSFDGLPETNSNTNPIQYFGGNYKAEDKVFLDNIASAGLDMSRVTTTKGWFTDTLNIKTAENIGLKDISIAYIDCDVYESTKDVLNFILPYIKTGTVLIFDDWFRNKGNSSHGVQGAVLDWLDQNKKITLQHFYNCDTRTALFIVEINGRGSPSYINCV
jgi:O-methyltransferase